MKKIKNSAHHSPICIHLHIMYDGEDHGHSYQSVSRSFIWGWCMSSLTCTHTKWPSDSPESYNIGLKNTPPTSRNKGPFLRAHHRVSLTQKMPYRPIFTFVSPQEHFLGTHNFPIFHHHHHLLFHLVHLLLLLQSMV